MFWHFFQSARLRSAARRWAREAWPQLQKDYGSGESFTSDQIRAAARRVGLSDRYLVIGYAVFLPEEAFAELAGPNPIPDRDSLRALFWEHADVGIDSEGTDGIVYPIPRYLGGDLLR
ncbi:hypothetical protein KXR53_11270 [Inquilinus limosus]|uniref:DUF6559 family protein n=1 Tax=Inquilinus limosus TaxID=171674 RepID=UPI003F140285